MADAEVGTVVEGMIRAWRELFEAATAEMEAVVAITRADSVFEVIRTLAEHEEDLAVDIVAVSIVVVVLESCFFA